MNRRVVVTGVGAVSPCGHTGTETWDAMVAGRSGIKPITKFECADWPTRIAGEVKDFDPVEHVGKRAARRMDLFTIYSLVAAREAMAQAGIEKGQGDPARMGVYVGSGIGGLGEILRGHEGYLEHGPKGVSAFYIPKSLTNLAAGHLAMEWHAEGPSLCVTTACATGNHSIGEAWRVISGGWTDVVIAGGTEAPIVASGVAGFMVMRALSSNSDEPEKASRPFDLNRDGFVIGEGAGILVLESLEHAQARGAEILAELVGYGLSNDAYHLTAPAPGGRGAVRCMRMALETAGVNPEDVDYVNAHGTSTPANDSTETEALHTTFGDHAHKLMVSSTKSVTGHLLGAAGGVEALAAVMSIKDGVVPPTATWETRDPACDLDYVPKDARQHNVDVVLTNSFGFGGTNASLVFRRFTG